MERSNWLYDIHQGFYLQKVTPAEMGFYQCEGLLKTAKAASSSSRIVNFTIAVHGKLRARNRLFAINICPILTFIKVSRYRLGINQL